MQETLAEAPFFDPPLKKVGSEGSSLSQSDNIPLAPIHLKQ